MCIILPLLPNRSPTTTTISRSYHLQPRSAQCASCCHYCTFMGQTDIHKKFRLFTKFSFHFKQIVHPVLVSYSTGYHLTCVASAIITKFKTSLVPGSRLTSELYHKSWDVPNPTLFIASFDLCVCVSVFLSILVVPCSIHLNMDRCFPSLWHIFCRSSRKIRRKWIVNYAWNCFVVWERITAI